MAHHCYVSDAQHLFASIHFSSCSEYIGQTLWHLILHEGTSSESQPWHNWTDITTSEELFSAGPVNQH